MFFQAPSYLRKLSADVFELTGISEDVDDDLSDLIDYDEKNGINVNGVCYIDEEENSAEEEEKVRDLFF